MDEFEKALRQINVAEVSAFIQKQEGLSSRENDRRLANEQEIKMLPHKVFAAHALFREKIEPILKITEVAYLQTKSSIRTSSSVFTGSLEQWLAHWKEPVNSFLTEWPAQSFGWKDVDGELHDMSFCAHDTFLDVSAAGNRISAPLIKFEDRNWEMNLKEIIIEFLKNPEKTHNTYTPHDTDNDH